MSMQPGETNGPGGSTADVAKDQASGVVSKVQEQGGVAAGALQQGGQQIIGETKAQVGKLNEEVQRQIHAVLEQAQQELGGRAAEQTDKAATNLRGLAEEFRALADGRPEEASSLVPHVLQLSQTAAHYADRLDSGGFTGVMEDLSNFARRRPGLFLVGALAAGMATARLARGAQKGGSLEKDSDSGIPSQAPPSLASGAPYGTSTVDVATLGAAEVY